MNAALRTAPSDTAGPVRSAAFRLRIDARTYLPLLLILALSSVLRLVNLRNSPGWYHDECIYVSQVWNLMHGQFQWDQVAHSFLPRLPFMHLTIMPLFLLFGRDIFWVRFVSALSGILTTALIYLIGREAGGKGRALLAAVLYSVSAYTVLINRWGFSYNLDCLLGAANLFCLMRFNRNREQARYLYLATLTTALGMLVDPVMVSRLFLLFAVGLMTTKWWKAAAVACLSLLPLGLYLAFMFIFHRPILMEDARVIFTQRILESTPWMYLVSFYRYTVDYIGWWMLLGVIGVFFARAGKPAPHKNILLWSFLLDLAMQMKSSGPDVTILFRTAIILAPALFIGLAFAIAGLWRLLSWPMTRAIPPLLRLRFAARIPTFALGLRICIATAGVLYLYLPAASGAFTRFNYDYNEAVVFAIDDADAMARWANERLKPEDLVVSSHINWMLNCRSTSPMIIDLVQNGQRSPIYFDGLKKRLLYPCNLANTRWVIIDEAFEGLRKHYHFDRTLQEISTRWTLIHTQGPFRVYQNPDLPSPLS